MSLKEKVMLVNLNISQWSARKYDKKVSKEVNDNHNAKDAGRFNKMLIASEIIREIERKSEIARDYHYANTLPWGNNGDRILPADNYFTYISRMSELKNDFEQKVSDFVRNYPTLKESARDFLGTMFIESDYPHVNDIARRFSMSFSFMPIADVEDIRIAINDEEINRIKNDIESALKTKVDMAQKHLLDRVRDHVQHIVTILSNNGKIFQSLIDHTNELIDMMPVMNFNHDQHINDICKMLKTLVCPVDDLRNNESFRKEIIKKAEKILQNI